jgi:glycosyltransferase involved in cell wall biosynthesis
MNKPLVSVAMPAYNAENYIAAAIESILGQSFRDFELIIIDDGSTDDTLRIINKYSETDERVVVLKNDRNLGVNRTMNKGIEAARGKYIAIMNADDISLPERLEKEVRFLEENSEVGIVGGAMVVVNATGRVLGDRCYYTRDEEIRKHIFRFSPFSHPTVMIRRTILDKSGLYDPHYESASDYELYFRIGLHAKFANLEDKLIKYRIITGSLTTGGLKTMELKTIEARRKFFDSNAYQANKMEKVYNFLHLLSVRIPIIPPKQKMWLFNNIRGLVGPGA